MLHTRTTVIHLVSLALSFACIGLAHAAPLAPNPKTDHILGAKNPSVIIIEYSDFECPFCQRHFGTMQQVLKKYPNDVQLVFRHMPLSFHPNALMYARATECAAAQKPALFWKYHDQLFKTLLSGKSNLQLRQLVQIARRSGVDTQLFTTCLRSKRFTSEVQASADAASESGVNGTPNSFLINTKTQEAISINGAVPLETFTEAIDSMLAPTK
jgi:protein-disulfide isomerase